MNFRWPSPHDNRNLPRKSKKCLTYAYVRNQLHQRNATATPQRDNATMNGKRQRNATRNNKQRNLLQNAQTATLEDTAT